MMVKSHPKFQPMESKSLVVIGLATDVKPDVVSQQNRVKSDSRTRDAVTSPRVPKKQRRRRAKTGTKPSNSELVMETPLLPRQPASPENPLDNFPWLLIPMVANWIHRHHYLLLYSLLYFLFESGPKLFSTKMSTVPRYSTFPVRPSVPNQHQHPVHKRGPGHSWVILFSSSAFLITYKFQFSRFNILSRCTPCMLSLLSSLLILK